jgi:septal ring factor EnvC (AmiA/AmiB activator)
MLDAFKKKLVGDVANEALASLQAEFDSYKADANGLLEVAEERIQELTNGVNEANATVSSLQNRVQELEAALAEATAAQAAAAASEAELRASARKEKLEAAVGTEKASSLMAVMADMDDVKFGAVLSALAGNVASEAASEMFNEVGATTEVDANSVVSETTEMKMLKAKYGQK